MIVDANRIYDGWTSLEGGVDGGRSAELVNPNQLVSAENMTFRGGKPTIRPGFRKTTESFPPIRLEDQSLGQLYCLSQSYGGGLNPTIPYFPKGMYADNETVVRPILDVDPENVLFLNQNSETIYRNGVFQCAHVFNPHGSGADCIMALIGGRLFRITPGTPGVNDAKVDEILIRDDSAVQQPLPMPLRNKEDNTLSYMVQADKWLIAQDGISKAIIYDGAKARRALLAGADEDVEIPVGTIMAYGMGRICAVVSSRHIAFGDLYGSHDKPDPADSILLFTERTFLAGGFDAAIPFQQGMVTGLAFFPQLDTSTGNGQLLAFAERGAAAFFLSLPREVWQTSAFQILALLTTGMRGHRSLSVVNEDLWFRSEDGVRSYRQARSESKGWPHIPESNNVRQFMENDSDWLLKYASSISFDNRMLMTTSPAPNQGRPVHGGMVVADFDILSSFGDEVTKPAWDGHWTFPNGIMVSQILTGTFNGSTRAFAFCIENGVNQLFEISLNDNNDWDEQRIEWEFVTRL